MTSQADFVGVTELAGDPASQEQVDRLFRRYYWAAEYAQNADVLEIACGGGQGLGYLATIAKSIHGGDVSAPVLESARRHYGSRIDLKLFDAEQIPYPDGSFDVLLIFEAIYYVGNVKRFIQEARRTLRPNGYLLIATANKDLFDFAPSLHSVAYYGVRELAAMLGEAGFSTSFFGDTPLAAVSAWQRILRPVKRFATAAGLMPTNKHMKAVVKRFVFGAVRPLPAEIEGGAKVGPPPNQLSAEHADTRHKVIFCAARPLGL